jgi:hypothetical protein
MFSVEQNRPVPAWNVFQLLGGLHHYRPVSGHDKIPGKVALPFFLTFQTMFLLTFIALLWSFVIEIDRF